MGGRGVSDEFLREGLPNFKGRRVMRAFKGLLI